MLKVTNQQKNSKIELLTYQMKIFLPFLPERQDEMGSNHQRQQQISNQFLHFKAEKYVSATTRLARERTEMRIS
jgi:uncharacterized membrane protein YvbJ